MARKITQRELRNESGEIIPALYREETFELTRSGVPVGELMPLRRREFVASEAAVAAFARAPRLKLDPFRTDLDAVTDQRPTRVDD